MLVSFLFNVSTANKHFQNYKTFFQSTGQNVSMRVLN